MSNAFWYSTIYSVSAAFAFAYRYPLLNSGVFLVTVYVTIFEFAWDKSYSFWIEVLISFSPELVNTLAAALIEDDNTLFASGEMFSYVYDITYTSSPEFLWYLPSFSGLLH